MIGFGGESSPFSSLILQLMRYDRLINLRRNRIPRIKLLRRHRILLSHLQNRPSLRLDRSLATPLHHSHRLRLGIQEGSSSCFRGGGEGQIGGEEEREGGEIEGGGIGAWVVEEEGEGGGD